MKTINSKNALFTALRNGNFKMKTIHHWKESMIGETRDVSVSKTKSFALKTLIDGEFKNSYVWSDGIEKVENNLVYGKNGAFILEVIK